MDSEFLPWTEKYRPRSLSEVAGQEETVRSLMKFVEAKNMPNMLFAGPPGIGKTTATLALAHDLYGEGIEGNLLELNASDERGINVVRGKIKDFARSVAMNGVPFKLIFLDEADALTPDAQHALRRTMEVYSSVTRFILSCVSPDTMITLNEETEMAIGDYEEKIDDFGVATVDEGRKRMVEDKVLYCLKQNPAKTGKKCLGITTSTGRKLKVTDDHRLLTPSGWMKAGKLQIGDEVVIFPNLEGTPPAGQGAIYGEEQIRNFFHRQIDGEPPAGEYRGLPDRKKGEIREYILKLAKLSKNSLTRQEKRIYDLVSREPHISRAELQERMGLSRNGMNYHLPALINKGWIERTAENKVHRFRIRRGDALRLRNKMDIRRFVEREFGIRISYRTVRNVLEGKFNERYGLPHILNTLRARRLLEMDYSDKRAGALTRLFGFLLGDGHITRNHRIIFTSDAESLEQVKKDIECLGFKTTGILSKKLRSKINGREISGTTTWLHLNSKPLSVLFRFLGAPAGDKCIQEFGVPDWIMDGPQFVKREFLRAIFGCELYSPKCKKRNFEAMTFRQHKSMALQKNAEAFFKQLSLLLGCFGVESYIRVAKAPCTRKDGTEMCIACLTIGSSNKNLFEFFRKVNVVYSPKKELLGRYSAEYLREKLYVIEKRRVLGEQVLEAALNGASPAAISRSCNCTLDFVADRKEGKEVHLPRDFPCFDEWVSHHGFGREGLVTNKIDSVEGIELTDVRDISCETNHNFIANGIVAHNCNYSSKIIEPLQSRCAVFRFLPLGDGQVHEMLRHVAQKEGLTLDGKAEDAIAYVSSGDMRKAINALQGAAIHSKTIGEELIYKISSRARPKEIREMVDAAYGGNFSEARKMLLDLSTQYGLSGSDIILQVYREVVNLEIPEKKKVALVDRIGEYDFRLVEGANEHIQIEALLAQIMLLGMEKE